MKKPVNTSKWGKATAEKRYADGGSVAGRKPMQIRPMSMDSVGPVHPDEPTGQQMTRARMIGHDAIRAVRKSHGLKDD